MRTPARIALWNLAFVVCLAGLLVIAAVTRLDSAAFGLPALLAVWILMQGAVFARRRAWVVRCAVASSLLFLLQVAVLAFFVWWNRGFGNTEMATQSLVLMIWVVLGGIVLIAWFLRAKRGVRS